MSPKEPNVVRTMRATPLISRGPSGSRPPVREQEGRAMITDGRPAAITPRDVGAVHDHETRTGRARRGRRRGRGRRQTEQGRVGWADCSSYPPELARVRLRQTFGRMKRLDAMRRIVRARVSVACIG